MVYSTSITLSPYWSIDVPNMRLTFSSTIAFHPFVIPTDRSSSRNSPHWQFERKAIVSGHGFGLRWRGHRLSKGVLIHLEAIHDIRSSARRRSKSSMKRRQGTEFVIIDFEEVANFGLHST